jgi:quercetin dioxygenase-like cupin family protein
LDGGSAVTAEERHEIRVLITGVDDQGRSCVVGEERVALGTDPASPGFWFGSVFETTAAPPPARPDGRADYLETGVEPGHVRWQVVDYAPSQVYPMHHTDTVDLDLVLAGSVELTLDDGVHILQAGDGAVINGVDHAWAGGPEGARLSVMFVGTPPRGAPDDR